MSEARYELKAAKRLGIGIDVGSTTTKGVLLDSDMKILASHLTLTGASASEAAKGVVSLLAEQSGISLKGVKMVSTGYGRSSVQSADKSVTEITCHSLGIHLLNPSIATLIDVGGQDSKVIRIGENGRPADFELNDKCSAGTGRFLEVMARVLGTTIDELGPLALRSKKPSSISSTCTVFAESEVVGRIGAGDAPADIAAGVHQAMASKIATLARRVGVKTPAGLTGGVALNPAFKYYLSKQLSVELWVPEQPQTTGAIGAALLALTEK